MKLRSHLGEHIRSAGRLQGFVAALFILAALLAVPCQVFAQAKDLDLTKAKDKVVDDYDRPNPHMDLDCSDCHDGEPNMERDTWATVKFINGEDGNVDLCYNCHDASDNVHPIHVDPTKGTPPVAVPG